MNRDEQNDYCKLGALASEAKRIADKIAGQGQKTFAADIRCAVTKIKKTIDARLNQLELKNRQAVSRSFQKIEVFVSAPDQARMISTHLDDEEVTIKTQDLYDLAEQAILACSEYCNGNKKDCKLRDQMLIMGIPVYDEYAEACPYHAKQEPVGTVGNAMLKALNKGA